MDDLSIFVVIKLYACFSVYTFICMSHFTVYNNIFPSESVLYFDCPNIPLVKGLMTKKGS